MKSILTNEKYRGDALLQKQYTTDFLQKKRKTNNGEIPQYYVEEHHEAIIPPAQFDFVQAELARREQNGCYSGVSIPTLVVMKNGKVINQAVGARPKAQILAML